MLSAWVGGLGPGLLVVVFGALASIILFIQPMGSSPPFDLAHWGSLIVFLVTCGAVVVAVAGMRRARTQVAAAAQSSQQVQRLAAIVDSSEDAIVAVDLSGRVLTWNTGAQSMFGWSPPEAIGQSVEMLLPPDRSDDIYTEIGRIQRGERIPPYETLRRRKDGTLLEVALSVSPVREKSGRIIGASKILRDMSRFNAARRERERLRQQLAAIVDSSEDAIITVDLSGRVLTWNAAAHRMLGWSAAEIIGQSVEMFLPADRPDDFYSEIERIRRGERIAPYETLRRRRDGAVLEVALSVSPVRDETGEIVGASKIMRDITALNAARKEKERTRELFLATLGHDLRNPLNTITASAYLLQRQPTEMTQKAANRIQSSANRMARMIEQLLDFTRARLGGGIPMAPKPADLAHICKTVVEEVEAQYPDRVQLVLSGDLEGVWDEDRITQVVSNLVGNGLDHGDPAKPVFVRLGSNDGAVQLEVTNSGQPIPPDLLPKIFDPFRRGSHERYGAQKGLGLGLFIARTIVETHGGNLEVGSTDQETTFRMTLPRNLESMRASGNVG